ncbi:unnamed protein product [Adineta ricciae]|uniref:Uncharacterized protein n=1 Tax=Adineta ricciae TaxID=249248 RepID=A0A813XS31_ADIRI|nr:unnamed protein product [Adineta ricciae]
MLLHDNYFFLSKQSINETHYRERTIAHSPLFHSTTTLVLSIFGICSNFLSMVYLCLIIFKNQRRTYLGNRHEQSKSSHVLSHEKYKFLIFLTSNDFLLCLLALLSCIDGKYYSQSLVANYHSCSFHSLLWKFTLHFSPLLTIFILFRYHYILAKKFPTKYFNTTTFNQLFCSDLCTLIPFLIAIAWSVDGLWLWGETYAPSYIKSVPFIKEQNQTSPMHEDADTQRENFYLNEIYASKQKLICNLQTNNDLSLTTRLLHLIQADFILLCVLHFLGLLLEIFLHIRLTCCLIARSITPIFLREQQLSLDVLYIFLCLTLTALPFYIYRSMEVLFESIIVFNQSDIINSRMLAQLILFGICFKPFLYILLLCPSNILFKLKCYTSIHIDRSDSMLSSEQQKSLIETTTFQIPIFYPKIHRKFRTQASRNSVGNNESSLIMDRNIAIANNNILL